MANEKNRRRRRINREQAARRRDVCALWPIWDLLGLAATRRRQGPRSVEHLRNAGIEVLEAFRSLLDEVIEGLRGRRPEPRLRRIRVEG